MQLRVCKDCGKRFELTDGEIEFYESRGLELPRRCESCREKRKREKACDAGSAGNTGSTSGARGVGSANGAGSASSDAGGGGGTKGGRSKVVAAIIAAVLALSGGGIAATHNAGQPADTGPAPQTSQQAVPQGGQQAQGGSARQAAGKEDTRPLVFRSSKQLKDHYKKHGKEMGFESAQDYEAAAAAVARNKKALHKTEREDGDDVYYLEASDEIVFVSPQGYIRTYFNPGGRDYFDRQ